MIQINSDGFPAQLMLRNSPVEREA